MKDKLYIRNMVCDRCVMAVRQQLEKSSISYEKIDLGEVTLGEPVNEQNLQAFKTGIEAIGFELIEDRNGRVISAIKKAVLAYVRDPNANRRIKFSSYLSDELHKEYSQLSSLFSSVEGTTIEQHLINQKIERVKELLVYDEQSLSQIAHDLGYSSLQHLSNQFKKVTGLTPTHFRQVKEKKRMPLDRV